MQLLQPSSQLLQPSSQLVASTSIDLIDLSSDGNASFNPGYKSTTPPGDNPPPLPAHSLEEISAWPGSPSPRAVWGDTRSTTPPSPGPGARLPRHSNRSSWSAPGGEAKATPIYWELEMPADHPANLKSRFVDQPAEDEERKEKRNRRRMLDKPRVRRSSPMLDVWVPRSPRGPETLAPPPVQSRRSVSCEQLPAAEARSTKHRCPTPPRLVSPSLDAVQCEVVADI
ncbi:hypothetical protein CAPTEDRAFT_228863 [Capitella teleta]|uniref:Uncharacterized protein n=1 Tax=Capitella teleta TaxID=283909 RepID=R7TB13_CAPTE|nr:hypothetical protein CAPTEDRAFT_228863 [Capitella teleta]|eukprot:ELT88184.1 hypothetical protein CAPTEDRAFT_228863 [Capitella teleta]